MNDKEILSRFPYCRQADLDHARKMIADGWAGKHTLESLMQSFNRQAEYEGWADGMASAREDHQADE